MVFISDFGDKIKTALKELEAGIEEEVESRFSEWIASDDDLTYLSFMRGGKVVYSTEYKMLRRHKQLTIAAMAQEFIDFELMDIDSSHTEIIAGIRETIAELRKAADRIDQELDDVLAGSAGT